MKLGYIRLLLLGIVLATLSPKAQEVPQPPIRFARETLSIKGNPAFLIMPTSETIVNADAIPWVLYAPTFEGRLPSDRDEGWMMERWLKQGIAIAGVDIGESYGNPEGRAVYSAFHKHLVEKYHFDRQASLLARSRGGLMLYCWAVENPEKVRCIAGIYPVCDLTSYPGIQQASPAYNLTVDELSDALPQHNPIPRLASLAKAKVPILHIHGDQDKLVPLAANSQALATAYKNLGGEMTLIVATNQWHNMWRGFFECQELVDFVSQHATVQQSR